MISSYARIIAATLFVVSSAAAQTADKSGNATLTGNYFVREVLMTGGLDGKVTAAASVIGVATFDGNGHYAFTGQGTSIAAGPNAALTLNGTYSVGSNGILVIQSLADPTDVDYGGVSAIGPSAFVASATEGNATHVPNVNMLIAIPAGANKTNGSLTGSYAAGAIDFPSANADAVRQATLNLSSDGAGNLGTISVSGVGANLGGNPTTQTIPGATYALSGTGSGTINLGAAAASQLVSGTKTFYISNDGNIVLGGSPTGYDLLVGIKSLTGTASNATANGIFYMAGLEQGPLYDSTGTTLLGSTIDAYYGSGNFTGSGVAIFHKRFESISYSIVDYTYSSAYTVQGDGTIAPTDIPYQFTLGVNGQAFIATGAPGLYSLTLGLGAVKYTGTGVFVNPLGVVNAANFAPVTNPIAPNELIAIVGTGLASGPAHAQSLPLPTTLGGVSVTINGQPAPLIDVQPGQIAALVPATISPSNNAPWATVVVTNNSVPSNPVTVFTSETAPGVFSIGALAAVGPAAAQHANFTLIGASSPGTPAVVGEKVIIYVAGLGAVSPAVPVGAAAPSDVLSKVTTSFLTLDFCCDSSSNPVFTTVDFAGLTPTTAGLYQVNVPIPSFSGPNNLFVELSTLEGTSSEATLNISGQAAGSGLAGPAAQAARKSATRPNRQTRRRPGLTARGR